MSIDFVEVKSNQSLHHEFGTLDKRIGDLERNAALIIDIIGANEVRLFQAIIPKQMPFTNLLSVAACPFPTSCNKFIIL